MSVGLWVGRVRPVTMAGVSLMVTTLRTQRPWRRYGLIRLSGTFWLRRQKSDRIYWP